MGARELDLLRRWTLHTDPEDRGVAERWWESLPGSGIPCRTDQAWQQVLGEDYHGVAWYHRRARLPRKWLSRGQRVWLRFGSVATACRVWVNGIEIGSHAGDYVPFEFEITVALGGQEHAEIVCRVNEIRGRAPKVWGQEPWGGHITKGFHDVLGIQHGGVWGGVRARATGPIAIRPNGFSALADPETGEVRLRAEFHPHDSEGAIEFAVEEPGIGERRTSRAAVARGAETVELSVRCEEVRRWSPDTPVLGRAEAVVRTRGVPGREEAGVRFGFRTVAVGGKENRHILLNDRPILIRGMLDWGIEKSHAAPAPTREEVRERFAGLRERGFNCVCLCMVYPPDWFYEIADESGMMLWQIHPVWKSDMSPDHHPEYRRLFDEFFRRDRRHASVVVVSATCEHECFAEPLAHWWWDRAREALPRTLLQVQTGFLQWSDTERMDLIDEHTYDNTGRWVTYMDDMESYLLDRPARPFVMGETIIGTSWPDTRAIVETIGEGRPWWAPKGLDGFVAAERCVRQRFGEETLERMREQSHRFALGIRKAQSEIFRSRPHNAGWVMNHLCDVSVCQCGFRDDLERWRFSPAELRPFLDDSAVLCRAPGWAVALRGESTVQLEIGLSNFGRETFEGDLRVRFETEGDEGTQAGSVNRPLVAQPGEVRFESFAVPLGLKVREKPVPLRIHAEAPRVTANVWRFWTFPTHRSTPASVRVRTTQPWAAEELAPSFEEKRYSSGWALECERWRPRRPELAVLAPETPEWEPLTESAAVVLATRLDGPVLTHLERGGRAMLVTAGHAGGPPARWANLYGQVPLVTEGNETERRVLGPGESEWLLDVLDVDLNRWSCRAVPVGELGIADRVEPVVRLNFTHDKGSPDPCDQLFLARVGRGLLAVSTLDHSSSAGIYLLDRVLAYLDRPDSFALTRGELGVEQVMGWSVISADKD